MHRTHQMGPTIHMYRQCLVHLQTRPSQTSLAHRRAQYLYPYLHQAQAQFLRQGRRKRIRTFRHR